MYQKSWSYAILFLRYDGYNCYFSFWAIFCTFTSLTAKKNKIPNKWKKKQKTTGDIIIVHKCTKNHDHILYCSWDMVRDECNYFSFWAIFWPFTSITAQKVKISNKWKKHLKISSFNISVPKILIICFTVPGICCVTDVIIFHFGPFFALLPS